MSTAEYPQTVYGSLVLHGVSWEQYNVLVDAMADHRFRHTYDNGLLEIFGETLETNAAARNGGLRPPISKADERAIILHDISPAIYSNMLAALGDYRLRHSYRHGTLEIMSPSRTHEWENRFLERLIKRMCEELEINVQSLGSWTLKPSDFEQGIEPDSCFYIANEPKVRFRHDLNLDKDPPPDLAIEIDFSSSSLARQPIYESLGVPELWRYSDGKLEFYQLASGEYRPSEFSAAFPFLPSTKLEELLDARDEKTELELEKSLWLGCVRMLANSRRFILAGQLLFLSQRVMHSSQ